MYNGIQKIEKIIEYIECNITSEIDYEELASRMTLSLYEFRRIFAFVVGCPLSEYVRKRRLSLAACDLMTNSKTTVQEIGEKYGLTKTGVAAAWILRHPANMQLLAGTMNPEHLTEICKAADVTLTRSEWYEIYRAAGHMLP